MRTTNTKTSKIIDDEMSEVKKNHYVPRFYLRNFTDNPESETGKFEFYNIKLKKMIGLIPHKEQMREKYFYEKGSVIDNKLSVEFEGIHSSLVKQILNRKKTSEEMLSEIILLMHFRTKAQRDENISLRKLAIDTFVPNSFKAYLRKNAPFILKMMKEEDIDQIAKEESYKMYLNKNDIAEKNLKSFERLNKEIDDLNTCVLENKTDINFISSDKPVVLINPFLRKRVRNIGIDGFLQRGLVLFLPLNPQYLLCAYDDFVYEDFEKKVLSISDVKNLNKLQILGGVEGVYSIKLPNDIEQVAKEILEKKITPRLVQKELPSDLIYMYKEDLNDLPSFVFIKEKLSIKDMPVTIPFSRKDL